MERTTCGISVLPDLLLFGVMKGSVEIAGVKKGFDWVETEDDEIGSVLALEPWRRRVFTDRVGGARPLLLLFSIFELSSFVIIF